MKKITLERIFNLFIKSFLQGFVIIGPLGVTIFVVVYVIRSVDSLMPSVANKIPGLVFISAILITAILGFLVNKFVLGKLIFEQIDSLLENTPGVKHLYNPAKEIMSSFVGDKKKFNTPVWVKVEENPEIWRIGFLTQNHIALTENKNLIAVYLPHSYAISGWVILIKKENIIPITEMDAASAMKFAVSGGIAGFSPKINENSPSDWQNQ